MVVAVWKIRNSEDGREVLELISPIHKKIERSVHFQPAVFSTELDSMMAMLPGDVVLKLKGVGETPERIKEVVAQRGQSRNFQHSHRTVWRKCNRQPPMPVVSSSQSLCSFASAD